MERTLAPHVMTQVALARGNRLLTRCDVKRGCTYQGAKDRKTRGEERPPAPHVMRQVALARGKRLLTRCDVNRGVLPKSRREGQASATRPSGEVQPSGGEGDAAEISGLYHRMA